MPAKKRARAKTAVKKPAAAKTAAATDASARQRRAVILIVEDAADSRDVFAQFLAQKGLRVITAADGPGGLRLAREIKPDVIVLDLGLPIVDGWEVARLLRSDTATKGLCIIAVSGYSSDEDQKRARDVGIDTFLVKPCSPENLYAAVVSRL